MHSCALKVGHMHRMLCAEVPHWSMQSSLAQLLQTPYTLQCDHSQLELPNSMCTADTYRAWPKGWTMYTVSVDNLSLYMGITSYL